MQGYKAIAIGLVATAVAVVIYVVIMSFLPVRTASFDGNAINVVQGILWIGIPMYLGILFGQCFFAARAMTGRVNLAKILGQVTNSASTYAAIFFSPILFFLIYASSQSGVDNIQAIAFAFENGFFIQSVMRTFMDKHPTT